MSTSYTQIRVKAASGAAHSLLGLICLSILCGFYGVLLTFCRIVRIGTKRFFKQVERPSAPHKSTEKIYGVHDTIKLKVLTSF